MNHWPLEMTCPLEWSTFANLSNFDVKVLPFDPDFKTNRPTFHQMSYSFKVKYICWKKVQKVFMKKMFEKNWKICLI